MGEKLPGLTRWTGRVSGPQRSQSLGHHCPPGVPGLPRPRSHSSHAEGRPQRPPGEGGFHPGLGVGETAPGRPAPQGRPGPRPRAAPHSHTPRTRAPARPLPLEGRGFSKGGGIVRTPRRLFLLWLSPAPPARAPACAPPNPPARGRGGRRRAVRRGGRGRRFPRGPWAAGLGLRRAGSGGAALTCGRRRRAGQRAPGARAARGRADGGARGRAAPLPSSEEAPAVRRGPGRARLTSSILSGAGGEPGEGRPPRGLRRARAGSPCARPPASLTATPEATGSAGTPSADLLRVWVPCPPAGQSQRRDWSVLGAAQLSLPLCSAQQRNPLVNSGLVYGGSKYSKDRNIRLCTTFSTAD